MQTNFPEAFSAEYEEEQAVLAEVAEEHARVMRGAEIYVSFGFDADEALRMAYADFMASQIPVEDLLDFFSRE